MGCRSLGLKWQDGARNCIAISAFMLLAITLVESDLNATTVDMVTTQDALNVTTGADATTAADVTTESPVSCDPNPCISSAVGNITCNETSEDLCNCTVPYVLESVYGPCIVDMCNPNPCNSSNSATNIICNSQTGSCSCESGFALSTPTGPCTDMCNPNPCNSSNSATNITCNSTTGNCSCESGFALSTPTGPCISTDMCNPNPCDSSNSATNITCNSTTGSCSCESGFVLSTPTGPCMADPCISKNCSIPNTTCNSATGMCNCPSGFMLETSNGPCIPVEVTTAEGPEITTSIMLGGPTTVSREETTSIPREVTTDRDMNECQLNTTNNCDNSSTTCENILLGGGFNCSCKTGYLFVNATSCQTPCEAGVHGCDTDTTNCNFSSGQVECSCKDGYVATTNSSICTARRQCCPSIKPTSAVSTGYFEFSGIGRCVYFLNSNFGNYDTVAGLCASTTVSDGFTGGRILEIAGANLNQSLLEFVSANPFPPSVLVDFQRNSSSDPFVWNDTRSTVLLNNNTNWLNGIPSNTSDTNCGAIAKSGSGLGYINIPCSTSAYVLCQVSTITCSTTVGKRLMISRRLVIPVERINGHPQPFLPAHEDSNSEEFKRIGEIICSILREAVSVEITCTLKGLKVENGTIIAYVEVNSTRAQAFQEITQMLSEGGFVGDDGLHILTSSNGDTISIHPDSHEIDEMENHVCSKELCQNGGTCKQNNKLIESECSCTPGFQGTRCEAVVIDDNIITLTILAIVAVVIFIVLATCCCCLFVFMRDKSHSKKKMVYEYQPPVPIPQQFALQDLSSRFNVNQRIVRNVSAKFDEDIEISAVKFPIIRNRGVDRNFVRNDFADEDEDIDEDKTVDEKRLRHFERMVTAAGELNAHMSSRGDAASITSESASSVNSIIIPQLSETGLETIDEIHEFSTPYTTDGTTNT